MRLATPFRPGFLSASTPDMLRRCQVGPFSQFLRTPGDALLHYALTNFSSPVCFPIVPAPSSATPESIWVQVLLPSPAPHVDAIALLLKSWLGSAFETPCVRQSSPCLFSVSVASKRIAQFVLSLEGINYSGIVVTFHAVPPADSAVPKRFFIAPCPLAVSSTSPHQLADADAASAATNADSPISASSSTCAAATAHGDSLLGPLHPFCRACSDLHCCFAVSSY